MRNLKSKIVCVLLAFLMLCVNTPVSFETEVAMAAIDDDIIYADNLDIIFDTYKDVGAYAVAEYTGNYKATTFGDTMVDLYPFNHLYCKFVNNRIDFHGLLYTIDEAKDAFGSDNANVLKAEAAGRKYYAPGKDNSFRYEENVTDVNGVKKDAWFTDAYFRADKGTSVQGGMSFGIKDGSRITENDNELSFVFEYLDNDNGSIKVQYINTDWTGGSFVGNDFTIGKTGTGKWRTAVVPVNNAKFMPEANTKSTALCSGREDFLLKGNNMYISRVMVVKNSDLTTISVAHTPVPYPKTVITDTNDADGVTRTYNYMQINGEPTVRPYVTSQSWSSDGTKFIVGTMNNQMYEYDTVNETLRFLDNANSTASLNAFVTPDNYIYYTFGRTIYRINWNTYEREVASYYPSNVNSISTISVTNDHKYLSGYTTGNYGGNLTRINLETQKLDGIYNKNFSADNPDSLGVGHPIINPKYDNILFFCNEGTTTLIPDRLWMLDFNTGKMENIFRQSANYDGTTAECSGHEVWNKDGEYLYFVKYNQNQNKGLNGIVRIPFKDGMFTGEREYINGDAPYWHLYPSGDNNWVAGDVNTGEIYLISTKNHTSVLLADFDMRQAGVEHPYQPHPHFSYNNKSINWQMVTDKDDETTLGAAWIDVSNYTSGTDYTKNEYEIGSFGKSVSYKNTRSESTTEVKNGITFAKAQNGNRVYFDIDDSSLKTVHQQIKLTFTTYSDSADTINIGYTSGSHDEYELHKYEDKCIKYDIASGTNTYTVDLGYVNANNICKYATDLYFYAKSGNTYIGNIVIEPYSDDSIFDTFKGDMIYSIAGDDLDYFKGLQAISKSLTGYSSGFFHVDDKEGYTAYGITEEQATSVKNSGFSYISSSADGAWAYRTVTSSDGVTKNAWFTTRNKRVNTTSSYLDIVGQIYFRLVDETITAEDNTLIVTVEYLDNRTTPFTIRYMNTPGPKTTNTVTFTPTNTGKWKTETHVITDAMLSSTNSGTGLAHGTEDFRIEAARTDLYISKIIIRKPGNTQFASDIVYTNGSNISSVAKEGNISLDVTVTNDTLETSVVNVYSAVFDKFGDLMRVVKTDDVTLAALESRKITADAVKVDEEEIHKVFVWDDELYPYELPEVKHNFRVSVSGTTAYLSWDKYEDSSDYTYEVYCDGELISAVSANAYSHTGVSTGKHTWHIEVTDCYGLRVSRSLDIVETV